MADQGSFKAILDHPSEALWYLFSLPPHAAAAFLSMGRASPFPPKRKIPWGDGEELPPKFLEASCGGAGPPAGVPRELCIGEHPSPGRRDRGQPLQAGTIAFHLFSPSAARAKLVPKLGDWSLSVKARAGAWGMALDCPKYNVAL